MNIWLSLVYRQCIRLSQTFVRCDLFYQICIITEITFHKPVVQNVSYREKKLKIKHCLNSMLVFVMIACYC